MTLTAIAVAIAVVLSSAGCLVEEEKPVTVPDDRKNARLVVDGLVDTPLNWTLQQVVDLGGKDFRASSTNKVGTVVSGNFTGVLVSDLLAKAKVKGTPYKLELEASDGYKVGLPASNVTTTSYLALKEDGKWLALNDNGALRFVDSSFKTSFWVKKVVAIHIRPGVPDDRRDDRLVVDGEVDKALNWTLQQVVDLGGRDFKTSTTNSVGSVISANFTGVRLSDVLAAAKVRSGADMLELEASDGYKTVMFSSDVSGGSYLSYKEEGLWPSLADIGALRFVDSNLSSTYWVKKVVAIHAKTSAAMTITGLVSRTDFLTPGWLHENGPETVKWSEGTKNRTGVGIGLDGLLANMSADLEWGLLVRLTGAGTANNTFRTKDALDGKRDYLALDSKARFVYVRAGVVLLFDVRGLEVATGVYIFGSVGKEANLTVSDLMKLPPREIQYNGKTYRGAALETVIAAAGLASAADTVEVGSAGGMTLNITVPLLTNSTLAYFVDGAPIGRDDGFVDVLSDSGGKVAILRGIIWLRPFAR